MEGLLARVVMFGSWGGRRSMQLLRGGSLRLFLIFPAPAMQHTGKEIKCNMNLLDDFCHLTLEFHNLLVCHVIEFTETHINWEPRAKPHFA